MTPAQRDLPTPPPDLPADPQRFWRAGDDIDARSDLLQALDRPALERMGPSPFPRSGFPVLGFLATVYEHVANHARSRANVVISVDATRAIEITAGRAEGERREK